MGLKNFFRRNTTQTKDIVKYLGGDSRPVNMQLAAVYRCVQVISDGVATLPVELYDVDKDGYISTVRNDLSLILNISPNDNMTRFTLLKLWVQSMLLKGNAYGRIIRKAGTVTSIEYIPSGDVEVVKTLEGIVYRVKGVVFDSSEIIHILNNSEDGILGKSTISYAATTLNIASYATNQSTMFFKSGGNINGIITSKKVLSNDQKKDIQKSWQEKHGVDNLGSGSIAVLGADVNYTPISINPADAQLLESRQFEVVEIARFFGVSPTKLFDLSKSSYNTYEAGQLAFLGETLAPLLTNIEQEFCRKILLPSERKRRTIRFNVNAILRADLSKTASYYSQMMNLGGMTPNDVRYEIGLPKIKDGDTTLVQANLTTLTALKQKEINDGRE